MRKVLLIFGFLFASPLFAQNITSVTGTVIDPNGLPYSNGTVQAQLIPTGSTPTIPPPCNGQNSTPCSVPAFSSTNMDVNGTFSMNLASNTVLSPSGTQWQFTVSGTAGVPPPIGRGTQTFVVNITITGATQSVSATLSASASALSNGSANFGTLGSGTATGKTFNVGNGSILQPVGTGQVIASNASGTLGQQIAPNQNAFYVSRNCGTQTNCYQTPANTNIVTDGTFTASMPQISISASDPPFVCTGGVFPCSTGSCTTTNSVGCLIEATYNCNVAGGTNPEKCALGCPEGTIVSVQSATQATSSMNCTHTSVPNTGGDQNRVAWGAADDTAVLAAVAALNAAGTGTIQLPCVGMWLDNPTGGVVFDLNTAATKTVGPMAVVGCPGGTKFVIGFNYPYSTCSTTLSTNGGCFFDDTNVVDNNQTSYAGGNDMIRDVEFTGLGVDGAGLSPANAIGAVRLRFTQSAENVHVSGLNWNATANWDAFIIDGGAVRCGYANAGGRNAIRSTANGGGILGNGIGQCGFFNNGAAAGLLVQSNGNLPLYESGAQFFADNNDSCPSTSSVTDGVVVNSGATFYSNHTYTAGQFCMNGGTVWSTDDTPRGPLTMRGGILHVKGMQLTGSFPDLFSFSGTTIFDECGNVPGTSEAGDILGALVGSCSIDGTVLIATNITPSTGWGTTGAAGNGVSAVTGFTRYEKFTITATGTPTANPTIAITFPTTNSTPGFWTTPTVCTAQQIGGTGAIEDLTQTALSATSATFQWNGTPVAASTYIFNVICQN